MNGTFFTNHCTFCVIFWKTFKFESLNLESVMMTCTHPSPNYLKSNPPRYNTCIQYTTQKQSCIHVWFWFRHPLPVIHSGALNNKYRNEQTKSRWMLDGHGVVEKSFELLGYTRPLFVRIHNGVEGCPRGSIECRTNMGNICTILRGKIAHNGGGARVCLGLVLNRSSENESGKGSWNSNNNKSRAVSISRAALAYVGKLPRWG